MSVNSALFEVIALLPISRFSGNSPGRSINQLRTYTSE